MSIHHSQYVGRILGIPSRQVPSQLLLFSIASGPDSIHTLVFGLYMDKLESQTTVWLVGALTKGSACPGPDSSMERRWSSWKAVHGAQAMENVYNSQQLKGGLLAGEHG